LTRKILLTLLTLSLVACTCLAGTGLVVASVFALNPNLMPTASVEDNPFPVVLPDSLDGEQLPKEILAEMDQIQIEVAQIRRLAPQQAVYRDVLSPQQLQQVVEEEFFSDYPAEDARVDAELLTALGLLEPGFDLLAFYQDLYSEQVAGYYDPESKEMIVVQADDFTGLERMTYAHEYTHALQDQTYDLFNGLGFREGVCELDGDACAAILALIEGDATFTEQLWFFRQSTQQDKLDVQQFALNFQTPVFDSAPEFMRQDFMFPYVQGNEFVQTIYDRSGWTGIEAVYDQPPVSTEQILHPDLYGSELPQAVDIPVMGDESNGWMMIDEGVLGEWYTLLTLAYGWQSDARIALPIAKEAAAGWGGDRYRLYENDQTGQQALVVRWKADNQRDAVELFESLVETSQKRWAEGEWSISGSEQASGETRQAAIWIGRMDTELLWVLAPDANTLNWLKGGFPVWTTQ